MTKRALSASSALWAILAIACRSPVVQPVQAPPASLPPDPPSQPAPAVLVEEPPAPTDTIGPLVPAGRDDADRRVVPVVTVAFGAGVLQVVDGAATGATCDDPVTRCQRFRIGRWAAGEAKAARWGIVSGAIDEEVTRWSDLRPWPADLTGEISYQPGREAVWIRTPRGWASLDAAGNARPLVLQDKPFELSAVRVQDTSRGPVALGTLPRGDSLTIGISALVKNADDTAWVTASATPLKLDVDLGPPEVAFAIEDACTSRKRGARPATHSWDSILAVTPKGDLADGVVMLWEEYQLPAPCRQTGANGFLNPWTSPVRTRVTRLSWEGSMSRDASFAREAAVTLDELHVTRIPHGFFTWNGRHYDDALAPRKPPITPPAQRVLRLRDAPLTTPAPQRLLVSAFDAQADEGIALWTDGEGIWRAQVFDAKGAWMGSPRPVPTHVQRARESGIRMSIHTTGYPSDYQPMQERDPPEKLTLARPTTVARGRDGWVGLVVGQGETSSHWLVWLSGPRAGERVSLPPPPLGDFWGLEGTPDGHVRVAYGRFRLGPPREVWISNLGGRGKKRMTLREPLPGPRDLSIATVDLEARTATPFVDEPGVALAGDAEELPAESPGPKVRKPCPMAFVTRQGTTLLVCEEPSADSPPVPRIGTRLSPGGPSK